MPSTLRTLSRPDKPLFPDGLTKADLAAYYQRVAEVMLPHVRGRPVHMQRFPDGITGPVIQQKQAPDYFPGFVERVRVPRKRGGSIQQVTIENPETLVYLVDQACITPHVVLSRAGALDHPDQLIFDLDPPDGDLRPARRAARELRELLEGCGLSVYLKTTGSRGYHVVCPLDAAATFADAGGFAREGRPPPGRAPSARLHGRAVDRRPGRAAVPGHRPQRLCPDRGCAVRRARLGGRAGGLPAGVGRAQPHAAGPLHRTKPVSPAGPARRPLGGHVESPRVAGGRRRQAARNRLGRAAPEVSPHPGGSRSGSRTRR